MERQSIEGNAELAARAADGQAGITLIEIMIVLAIIALVMGFLVGPAVLSGFKSARVKTAKLEANQLAHDAFTRWSADHGDESCPGSIDDLQKYTNLKGLKDPWGQKYQMTCGEGDEGVVVVSSGPNKKMGDDDDIKSTEDTKK